MKLKPVYRGARNYIMFMNGELGRIFKEAAWRVEIYPAFVRGN
jgi:hypothetical protein